ncbi:flagellar hook-length control protein FliK [Rhodoferax aquaticus]|uniref:Flagellar hook-length control protein FliK n=1 Tax=Rhodoferax aquaticus TaxID=2527691 RepID=A0A515ETQ7_9BURK|nr:flagellar hook-length control protein FliK [Rhodoferax aquaticus]QDL56065.1 flagellar hook-length control protein FliK [Rhodoferax aquaticus]
MSIEKSPPPAREAKAPVSETKAPKSKSGATEESSAEGSKEASGGFVAILAALDSATPAPTAALPVDLVSSSTVGDANIGKDGVNDGGASLLGASTMDNAALLAQSQQWAAKAETGVKDADAKSLAPRQPGVPVAQAQTKSDTEMALPVAHKPPKQAPDLGSGKPDFGATLAATAVKDAPAESKTLLLAQKQEDQRMAPVAQAAAASVAVTVATPVREERMREFSLPKTQDNVSTPQGVASSSPSLSTATPAAVAPVAEVYVPEQVKYWMSGDVQNAEMKLDGIASTPVEVSISMQGNEAHVVFRTDEAQARNALETAGTQLKDMLMQEGLVLSGMSVGTSGSGASGSQERQGRQGARHATVPVAQNQTPAIGPLPPRNSGRTLDLFV